MRYIDKSKNANDGNAVTQNYLSGKLDPLTHYCSGISYGDFDKAQIRRILLANQDSLCCYCLRKLSDDSSTTLEHIIPQSTQTTDTARLRYYQRVTELGRDNVLTTDEYESQGQPRNTAQPPYPHEVAYNNLVASCNGTFPDIQSSKGNLSSCCCNNKRGAYNAFPIYYLQNVDTDLVTYLPDGRFQVKVETSHLWYNEIHEYTDSKGVNINHDSLVMIRRLWYLLRKVPLNEIQSTADEQSRKRLLMKYLTPTDSNLPDFNTRQVESQRLTNKFKAENQWRTFMLYSIFHQIMGLLYN